MKPSSGRQRANVHFSRAMFFPRTQIFHVGGADAGDDADFRARHFTQGSQFPGVVHAHFPYGGFVGRGGPEDAEGDADVVVQVALRGDGAEPL